MKVVITGGTGWVGQEVVHCALAHPAITHIVLLQRRTNRPSIDAPPNKKMDTIVHSDFSHYPDSLIPHLTSASAVLWCLGGRHNKFPDIETAKRINIEYTKAFTEFLQEHVLPRRDPRQSLRFVLCSGAKAEWNEAARLWFLEETRKMKGAAERAVFELAETQGGDDEEGTKVDAYTCRPAVILNREPGWLEWLHGMIAPSVSVDALATVMVELAVEGSKDKFWEFDMIKRKAQDLPEL